MRSALAVLALACLVAVVSCGGQDAAVSDGDSPAAFARVTPMEGQAILEADPAVRLIDVRSEDEFATGHIDGAVNLDVEAGVFAQALDGLPRAARYVVYCKSGNRSALAIAMMREAGFTEVYDLGGIEAWMADGLPIVVP